jgi:AraC-like DNA-binding protein
LSKKGGFMQSEINMPDYGVWIDSRRSRLESKSTMHHHNHLSILYVVSGGGLLEFEQKICNVFPNTIITLKKDYSHKLTDKPRQAMTVLSLYFDTEIAGLNKYIVDYLFNSDEAFVLPVYYAENIKRNLRQMLYEQSHKPPGYKLAINQSLSLTILQLYRARLELSKQPKPETHKTGQGRVKNTLDFIAKNSFEQYDLSDAARMASVSQRQFTNLCRKVTDKSYKQYLNFIRCEKAKDLLERTDMPVSAIAFEIGFEDLSTFYRAFKRIYSRSPLVFRH